MSLRKALVAVHEQPGLDPDDLPASCESVEILSGLIEAHDADLVVVAKDGTYDLTDVARLMVEQPVRLVS